MANNINYNYNNKNTSYTGQEVMNSAFQKQNSLFDSLVNELYNYNLYGRYKANDLTTTDLNEKYLDPNDDTLNMDQDNLRTQLIDSLNSVRELNSSTADQIVLDSDNLKKTYNYSAAQYRNQKFHNDVVKNEKDYLERRNYDLLQGVENNKKHNKIYVYYYKKNKAQLKILYYFLISILILIAFTFLNRQFKAVFNDLLYAVLTTIVSFIYVVYLVFNLYDIFRRDNSNYDEYNMGSWWDPSMAAKNLTAANNGTDSSIDSKCLAYTKNKIQNASVT